MRISCMVIDPNSTSTSLVDPIWVVGACTSSGCPNLRVDNITFGLNTYWSESGNSSNAEAAMLVENAFGVIDHNSIGSAALPAKNFELFNSQLGAYLGSGSYGDNSWAQPDSLGGANNLFAENNVKYDSGYIPMNDSEQDDAFTNRGGARVVMRYNTLYQGSGNTGGFGIFANHGTDSGGRARGAREAEVYNNTIYCQGTTQNCSGVDGGPRSGTALFWGNVLNASSAGAGAWIGLNLYRNNTSSWNPFSPNCGGFMPLDISDGASVSPTYTVTSSSSTTVTVSGTPWTTNQFAPVGKAYFFWDVTASVNGYTYSAITGNSSNQLTISGKNGTISNGDSFVIVGSTLYYSGSITSVGSGSGTGVVTMSDTSKSWGTNQLNPTGSPYTVTDITGAGSGAGAAWGGEISSNTSNSITLEGYVGYGPYGFATGDSYWVTRSTACLDQPARGQQISTILSGDPPSPIGGVIESIDPIYQWSDTVASGSQYGEITSGSNKLIAYRDFYAQASGAQTSSNLPFSCNGSTGGTGWGTLANRPSSCSGACSANSLGCGYWATDANELYVWESGAWTAYYTPYTYPHPLDTSGTAPGTPSSPTNLRATAN